MTADQDRALLLLSTGEAIRIGYLRHLGAYQARMLKALRDLTARGLATFKDGAYKLAEQV